MADTLVVKKVLDLETNKTINEIRYLDKDYNNNIEFMKGYRYTKLFHAIIPKFKTKRSKEYFNELVRYVEGDTNILLYRKDRERDMMTRNDMINILGASTRTIQRFLSEVKSLGILYEMSTTGGNCFVLNPAYGYSGTSINSFLFVVFQDDYTFNNVLTKNVIKEYNEKTKNNYKIHLKKKFPDIYDKIYGFEEKKARFLNRRKNGKYNT